MKENKNAMGPKMYEVTVALSECSLHELKQILESTDYEVEEIIEIALHSFWTYLVREGMIDISDDSDEDA